MATFPSAERTNTDASGFVDSVERVVGEVAVANEQSNQNSQHSSVGKQPSDSKYCGGRSLVAVSMSQRLEPANQ
jgi:hypothetical protein